MCSATHVKKGVCEGRQHNYQSVDITCWPDAVAPRPTGVRRVLSLITILRRRVASRRASMNAAGCVWTIHKQSFICQEDD